MGGCYATGNQYDIGHRGGALMSSLHRDNWDRQAGGQTGTIKYCDACTSKNDLCLDFSLPKNVSDEDNTPQRKILHKLSLINKILPSVHTTSC